MKKRVPLILIPYFLCILIYAQPHYPQLTNPQFVAEFEETVIHCQPLNDLPCEQSLIKAFGYHYLAQQDYDKAKRCADLLEAFPFVHRGRCGTSRVVDDYQKTKLKLDALVGLNDLSDIDQFIVPRIVGAAVSSDAYHISGGLVIDDYINDLYNQKEINYFLSEAQKQITIVYKVEEFAEQNFDFYDVDVLLHVDNFTYEVKTFRYFSLPRDLDGISKAFCLKKMTYDTKRKIVQLLEQKK